MKIYKMEYLQIYFKGQEYQDGSHISPYSLLNQPTVRYNFHPKKLYTLIMIDRDAPYDNNPYDKYFLHWMIVNSRDVAAPYLPPAPPKENGNHRYYLLLFEQVGEIKSPYFLKRTCFHPVEFIFKNNLILKASFHFTSHYESI